MERRNWFFAFHPSTYKAIGTIVMSKMVPDNKRSGLYVQDSGIHDETGSVLHVLTQLCRSFSGTRLLLWKITEIKPVQLKIVESLELRTRRAKVGSYALCLI